MTKEDWGERTGFKADLCGFYGMDVVGVVLFCLPGAAGADGLTRCCCAVAFVTTGTIDGGTRPNTD